MRILIVEDEPRLREALVQITSAQKYQVDAVSTGADGLDYGLCGNYDVIVLDVMLPGLSGFDVVRELRLQKIQTPVIMLTAKEEVSDKIQGLDSGADDYMTKPFSAEELLARIRALTRRQGEVILDSLSFGDLTLNLSAFTLYCGAKSVRLGFKELEVLRILMSSAEIIVPKELLLTKVWGMESEAEANNVEVYISFLRKKFGYLGSSVSIETIRKVGYRLEVS